MSLSPLALGAPVAALLLACGASDPSAPAGGEGQLGGDVQAGEQGCPRQTPASVPSAFPELTLPSGAQVVEPAASVPQEMRVDLLAPLTVDEGRRFFEKSLRRDGYEILHTDYEGFEAEVYFASGRRDRPLGMVWILVGCPRDSSTLVIRIFKEKGA